MLDSGGAAAVARILRVAAGLMHGLIKVPIKVCTCSPGAATLVTRVCGQCECGMHAHVTSIPKQRISRTRHICIFEI